MASSIEARAGTPRLVHVRSLLITNISHLVTQNEQLGELKDAAVYIQGNEVAWVGQASQVPQEFASKADETIDAAGMIVTPGLINTHAQCVLGMGWGQCFRSCGPSACTWAEWQSPV